MERIKNYIFEKVEVLKGVKPGTWVRLILMIISSINLILALTGSEARIEANGEDLYTVVSVVVSLIIGAVNFWKNNSFTAAAQAGDEYLANARYAKEEELPECDDLLKIEDAKAILETLAPDSVLESENIMKAEKLATYIENWMKEHPDKVEIYIDIFDDKLKELIEKAHAKANK